MEKCKENLRRQHASSRAPNSRLCPCFQKRRHHDAGDAETMERAACGGECYTINVSLRERRPVRRRHGAAAPHVFELRAALPAAATPAGLCKHALHERRARGGAAARRRRRRRAPLVRHTPGEPARDLRDVPAGPGGPSSEWSALLKNQAVRRAVARGGSEGRGDLRCR